MKKLLCATVVFLTFSVSPAFAQATTALWIPPSDVATVTAAQGLTYTLYVNNGVAQVFTGVACAGTAPILCQAPLPPATPVVMDTKYEITAKTATGPESPRSIPFIQAPAAPTAVRIR